MNGIKCAKMVNGWNHIMIFMIYYCTKLLLTSNKMHETLKILEERHWIGFKTIVQIVKRNSILGVSHQCLSQFLSTWASFEWNFQNLRKCDSTTTNFFVCNICQYLKWFVILSLFEVKSLSPNYIWQFLKAHNISYLRIRVL